MDVENVQGLDSWGRVMGARESHRESRQVKGRGVGALPQHEEVSGAAEHAMGRVYRCHRPEGPFD